MPQRPEKGSCCQRPTDLPPDLGFQTYGLVQASTLAGWKAKTRDSEMASQWTAASVLVGCWLLSCSLLVSGFSMAGRLQYVTTLEDGRPAHCGQLHVPESWKTPLLYLETPM